MKVRMTAPFGGHDTGSEPDLEDWHARRLIARGRAEAVEAAPVHRAELKAGRPDLDLADLKGNTL